MKKLIITMAATLILTTTGSTFAQDIDTKPEKQRQSQHRQQRGMPDMPVVEQFMRTIRRLDLEDEQRAGIRAIISNMKAEVRSVSKKIKAGHLQIKELIKADIFDEAAIANLASKEGDLTAERIMIASRSISQVLQLLTDEQRDQLSAIAEERQEKRADRRAQQTE